MNPQPLKENKETQENISPFLKFKDYKLPSAADLLKEKPDWESHIGEKDDVFGSSANIKYTSEAGSAICGTLTYGNNDMAQVIYLSTFSYPSSYTSNFQINSWISSYIQTIENCIQDAQNNHVRDLLLDVRSNGGGLVCLSVSSQYQLVPDWDFHKNNDLYCLYDFKKSSLYDVLVNDGYEYATGNYLNPNTDPAVPYTDMSWYTPNEQYTRGGILGNYSTKLYFPDCRNFIDSFISSRSITNGPWSKMLILTDGLCGSACALFATHLYYEKEAYTVSIGGYPGETMDISSFAGGNVEDWVNYASNKPGVLSELPTSAFTRFNHHEVYMGEETVPREFQRYPANFHFNYYSVPATLADYSNMWGQAAGFFSQIPANSASFLSWSFAIFSLLMLLVL